MLSYSDIAKMFEEIELRIVENLKLQLQKNPPQGVLTPQNWLVQKLKNLDAFRQGNLKIMQDYKPITATQQLLQASFQNGINQTNAFLNLQNSPNFFGIDATRINNLIDSITTIERHSETAILRMTDDVYRRTLHLAELEMASGTNLETAIDIATKSFLEQGINCIVYKDGRRVNIADYVRMALRTASMKATLHGRSDRFAQLGYDTVLISQYDRCSDTCLPWQGRVYIEDTFTLWDGEVKEIGEELWGKSNYCGKWFPLLSTAIEKGLFHPNCRHDMGLYIDGRTKIPEPIDAEKDLENYKIEQHQRALERKIRKAKRLVLGTLDKDTAKVYRKQLRALQSELKQFVSEHSDILKREYGREKIYDEETQNKSVPNPANENSQYYKPVETNKNDIFNVVKVANTGFKAEIKALKAVNTRNGIYISENANVKPKLQHEIDKQLSKSFELLKVSESDIKPTVCVVGYNEMGSNAVAAYNAVKNILYINDKMLIAQKTSDPIFACHDDKLSTILHECIHWKDASDYRLKFGEITAQNYQTEYMPYLNKKCKKALDKLVEKGYNVYNISKYASQKFDDKHFDETYTEYRVLKLLKG